MSSLMKSLRPRLHPRFAAILLVLGLPVSGCGVGTGAIVSSSGGGASAGVVVNVAPSFPAADVIGPGDAEGIVDFGVADMDADGRLDLVTANLGATAAPTDDDVLIFHQTADEVFTADPQGRVGGAGVTDGIVSMDVGDLRLDGLTDIVTANELSADVTILDQTPLGTFNPARIDAGDASCSPAELVVASFDGDIFPDIVLAAGEGVVVFRQTAAGTFVVEPGPVLDVDETSLSLGVADVDLDGDLDVAVATDFERIVIYTNGASGLVLARELQSIGQVEELLFKDVDLDGDVDLVAAVFDKCVVELYEQGPPLGFQRKELGGPAQTNGPTGVAVADLDGDTVPEIACSLGDEDSLVIFRHFAGFGFLIVSTLGDLDQTVSPNDVRVEDLNQDGVPDIVSQNTDDLVLFYGRLSGR
jgi:hypothetical protein